MLNDGQMRTSDLDLLTMLAVVLMALLVSVIMVWAAAGLGSIKRVDHEPIIITDAQE